MSESITVWIHIVAVAVWLGPQFFMFLVAMPALRLIEDAETRVKVMRAMIYRFGYLGWAALGVIVLTGVSNLLQENDEAEIDIFSSDHRYMLIFNIKMGLVVVMLLLTALHTFVIGPRQLRLYEQTPAGSPEILRLRRISIVLSGLVLLLSSAAVYAAAVLANHDYSFQPR